MIEDEKTNGTPFAQNLNANRYRISQHINNCISQPKGL
jgi:hypothetical protein